MESCSTECVLIVAGSISALNRPRQINTSLPAFANALPPFGFISENKARFVIAVSKR
jgi:hypothetical protein